MPLELAVPVVQLNLESWSSTNAITAGIAKITVEKGMDGGKKRVSASFFGWPEDHEFM